MSQPKTRAFKEYFPDGNHESLLIVMQNDVPQDTVGIASYIIDSWRREMGKAALLSLRIEEELAARLEILAKEIVRTKSYVTAQAIEEYMALHEWQVHAIKDGMATGRRGDMVSHEEVLSELKRSGTHHERKCP